MALTKKERRKVGPLLRRARRLMNNDGSHWLKSRLSGRKGDEAAYCAIGGLNAAAGAPQRYMSYRGARRNDPAEFPVLAEAMMVLATQISGSRPVSIDQAEAIIFHYNDDYMRRWEQVSHTLQAASEKADKLAEK